MKVYIMRGLPGAGKSRWTRQRVLEDGSSVCVVSADSYHYVSQPPRADGTLVPPKYEFRPENASRAHSGCLREFVEAIQQSWGVVIVDNTNTTAVELAPYVRLCEAFGIEYEIVFLRVPFGLACKRNVHVVPEATIWSMFQNLLSERLPAWWKVKFVEER